MSQQEVINEAMSIMFLATLGSHWAYFILLAVTVFFLVFLTLSNISLKPLKSTSNGGFLWVKLACFKIFFFFFNAHLYHFCHDKQTLNVDNCYLIINCD